MFFKNLIVYRLPANYQLTAAQLQERLAPQAFTPTTSIAMESKGWVSPRENEHLVHAVNNQFLITLCSEKKLLPASVVNEFAKVKGAEIEQQQGFAPGRKQFKEIKEQVTDELMPRAFSIKQHTFAWINPVDGYLVIDASTQSKAEEVLTFLIKSIDKFPVSTLTTIHSPAMAMTSWLVTDEAPVGFTVDQDTELSSTGDSKAKVRYASHTLNPDAMKAHIETGKQCTKLALTWQDKISFVLSDSFVIKRLAPLDVLKESDAKDTKDAAERFDSDMMLMTGEVTKMLTDVIEALGGEPKETH